MYTINTLTDAAIADLDMDRDAAFAAAREYITQIEKLESRTIDEDDLNADDYDFILESIRRSQPELEALPLDRVAHTRDKLHSARDAMIIAQYEHNQAIIAAKKSGASIVSITEASDYDSRQSIYDVINGKK